MSEQQTIRQKWDVFLANAVDSRHDDDAKRLLRSAFYAGAAGLMTVIDASTTEEMSTEEGSSVIERILAELHEFAKNPWHKPL